MSMLFTVASTGRPRGVTSVQLPPLSRVTWTFPSSLPAQSTPASRGDSSKAKIVPKTSTPVPSEVMGPPAKPWCAGLLVVRSGEITSHDWPPFRDRCTWLDVW